MGIFSSVQFSQSCRTLCDSMDSNMPGFLHHHQLLELAQTHVHWVSDAIEPSHPLSSPPPAFNPSQHQGLFQWVSSLHQSVSSVAQVCLTLWPYGLQHTRLPCPSPTPKACSDSCPSSQWCHPTSSSSVVLFSSCLQYFPGSGSFPMSHFFVSGGQSIRVSASAFFLYLQLNRKDQGK